MSNDADDGWGRPRPKFCELLPLSGNGNDVEGVDNNTMVIEELNRSQDVLMDDTNTTSLPSVNNNCVAPLVDYPLHGVDSEPCAELQQLYSGNKTFSGSLKNWYRVWENGEKSPQMRFTCIFTCPTTFEHFASGNMKKDAFNQMNKTATKVDEVYWYATKQLALNAAAAKALDCFSLRRCFGSDKSPWQRCIDSPYMLATDALPLPDLPSGVVLPTCLPHEALTDPPKYALAEHYISYLQKLKSAGFTLECLANEMAPGNDCYSSWSNMESTPLYSAIFTCHLSAERFKSGKLIGKEGTYIEEFMSFDKQARMLVPEKTMCQSEDIIVKINVIWYRTKKEAVDAAAGRAVDCLRHRLAQHKPAADAQNPQRYCIESPYTIDNTPKAWKAVSESALRAVGGDLWPSVPHEHRFTTLFDICDIHSLLESERDWAASYKAARYS